MLQTVLIKNLLIPGELISEHIDPFALAYFGGKYDKGTL